MLTIFILSLNKISITHSLYRVAASAKDSKAALEAAKIYTQDLNDMFQGAVLKKGDVVTAAYQKSLKDIASFKALTK